MAEKKIGGRTFRTMPILATDAIRLQVRMVKLVGRGATQLPGIIAGARPGASDHDRAEANGRAISAFVDIVAASEPDALADMMRDVVALSQIRRESGDYHTADIDGDFVGRPSDLFAVVFWVLQEQLGPFFAALLANSGQGLKGAA